jgi:hypothetical protein
MGWTAPRSITVSMGHDGRFDHRPQNEEGAKMGVTIIGIDSAKNVFRLHGCDEQSRAVLPNSSRADNCWPSSPSYLVPRHRASGGRTIMQGISKRLLPEGDGRSVTREIPATLQDSLTAHLDRRGPAKRGRPSRSSNRTYRLIYPGFMLSAPHNRSLTSQLNEPRTGLVDCDFEEVWLPLAVVALLA